MKNVSSGKKEQRGIQEHLSLFLVCVNDPAILEASLHRPFAVLRMSRSPGFFFLATAVDPFALLFLAADFYSLSLVGSCFASSPVWFLLVFFNPGI